MAANGSAERSRAEEYTARRSVHGTSNWEYTASSGAFGLAALWLGKKAAVLALARAYGFKRLYRRGLEGTDYAFPRSSIYNARVKAMIKSTLGTTLSVLQYFQRKPSASIRSSHGNSSTSAKKTQPP